MGVLDDAIREHLALRRRHGVSAAELERQEKEALGPARRPSPREAAGQAASAPAEPPGADIVAPGDAPVLADRPAAGDLLADEAPADEAQAHEHFEEYGVEPLDAASEEATRISAPGALDDERILDEEELAEEELADELAGREGGLEDSEGPESPTEEHTTVFSSPRAAGPAESVGDGEELPEGEPAEEEPLLADERALDEEAAPADDDELLEEEAELAEADEPLPEGSPAHAAGADEDEDVLDDTPDFLQETPEHERLWFEQKPPRDFDLDR